jgi:hypothetical protein
MASDWGGVRVAAAPAYLSSAESYCDSAVASDESLDIAWHEIGLCGARPEFVRATPRA